VRQPLALIERDCPDYTTLLAVKGHELAAIDGPLDDHHLVGNGGQTHRLDAHVKLARPEGRDCGMRAPHALGMEHVVRGDARHRHGVAPMLQRHELAIE